MLLIFYFQYLVTFEVPNENQFVQLSAQGSNIGSARVSDTKSSIEKQGVVTGKAVARQKAAAESVSLAASRPTAAAGGSGQETVQHPAVPNYANGISYAEASTPRSSNANLRYAGH